MTYIIKTSTTKEKRAISTIIKDVFEYKEYDTINLLKNKNTVYVRITYSKGKRVDYGYNPDLEFYTKPTSRTFYFYNEFLKKDIENKKLKVVSLPEFIEILKYKEPEEYIKIKLMTNL